MEVGGGSVTNLILQRREACPAGTPCAPTCAALISQGKKGGRVAAADTRSQAAQLSFQSEVGPGKRKGSDDSKATCNYSSR